MVTVDLRGLARLHFTGPQADLVDIETVGPSRKARPSRFVVHAACRWDPFALVSSTM
jgi:hypothetical protein